MERFGPTKRSTPEQQKSHELAEGVLEHIIQEGKEVGSGKDGIVFKIDLTKLDRNERHLLVEDEIITTDEEVAAVAVKILKVYNPDLGDHEFKMQKRAREILLRGNNVVHIPDTTTARDQHINKETQNRLNAHGAQLTDKAEIIVMDFIDGQDLGTMMYNFALKKMEYEDEYIADLSYGQKEHIVGKEIGFELPDIQSAQTPEDKASMQAITFNRNEEKLFKYLKKQGFKFDPVIFEKIDNAVHVLNKNGFFHNDLHKQNVMVGTDGEVYIIDFGRSDSKKRKDGIADTLLSNKWKGLIFTEQEEQLQIYKQELAKIEHVQKTLLSYPAHKERIDLFLQEMGKKGVQILEKEFALSRGDDSKFEKFLVMLHLARDSKEVGSEIIDSFVASLENRQLRSFERNKLNKLKKAGYF